MGTPLSLPNGSLLVLTPTGGPNSPFLTPYSARGLTEKFSLIGPDDEGEWLERDVNGTLQDLSDIRFRKLKLTISCRDGESPCLDQAWKGTTVTVETATEFSYPSGGSPQHIVVSGSSRTQGDITYYRAQLTMMVMSTGNAWSEYPAQSAWEVRLEEV